VTESGGERALVVHRWLPGSEAAVEDGWTRLAPLDDFVAGKAHEVTVFGHPVVCVRMGDEVHAVDGYCPHRGMPLGDGHVEGEVLMCIWHGFEYDVRTGAPVWPDNCGLPLDAYDTRLRDGVVELRVRLERRA
jgi:nitrite reductase/ring-hydroxylating ferredoxin subunit